MLEKLFLQILNMSFTASVVILFVLFIRFLGQKLPKVFAYALWAVVLFRLVCPFSFESMFSILPIKTNPLSPGIVYEAAPVIDTGIALLNDQVNPLLPAAIPGASVNPLQIWIFIGAWIWLVGIVILLSYSLISLRKLQKRLKGAVCERENIYLSSQAETPFVIGLFKPKIYLPVSLTGEEKNYVLLHEQMHLKRRDHLIKPFSFLVVCLHWFNPLVWVAFFAAIKDMEMSCDEAVIKQLGGQVKQDYSASLLALATGRRIIGGSPLAFGEGETKGRIKNILKYREPRVWLIGAAVVLSVIVAGCLAANPRQTLLGPDFSIKAGEVVVELGSTAVVPLELLSQKEIAQGETDEVWTVESYDGFNLTRDSSGEIVALEVLTDDVFAGRGITIGSTRKEVLKAYPEIKSEEQKVQVLWFDQAEARLEFYFLNDLDQVSDLKIYRKTEESLAPVVELVTSLGEALKLVSITAPENVAVEDIRTHYGEFITPKLLEQWVTDPSSAPGRRVSSPWPERIEIEQIAVNSPDSYELTGYIIEVTSEEMAEGGAANQIPVVLLVKKIGTRWLIDDFKFLSAGELLTGYLVIENDQLYLDEVEIIRREDSERIKELHLDPELDFPSGYYLYNPDAEKKVYELTKDTVYSFVDLGLLFIKEADGDRIYTTNKKEEFLQYLHNTYSDSPPAQKVPYFVHVDGCKVISVTEEFGFTI